MYGLRGSVRLDDILYGYFFKNIGFVLRIVLAAAAVGGIVLSAHRGIVGQPLTLAGAVMLLALLAVSIIVLRRRNVGAALDSA